MEKRRGGEEGYAHRLVLPPLVPPRKEKTKNLSREQILNPTEVHTIAVALTALTSYRRITKDQRAFEICSEAIKGLQQLSRCRGAQMVIVAEGDGVFVNLVNPDYYWSQATDLTKTSN